MTNERDDLIVLLDEEGQEAKYELLDTIEMNNNEYVILTEYAGEEDDTEDEDDIEDEEIEEIIMLRIEHGENGEDNFVSIDDEAEMDTVFEEFKRRMEDEYDFEE